MTSYISLTQGLYALVNDEDYGRLSRYKWCAAKIHDTHYAARSEHGKTILMHREMFSDIQPEEVIHHLNGKGLDNHRHNLQIMTQSTHRSAHGLMQGAKTLPPLIIFSLSETDRVAIMEEENDRKTA